MRAALAIAGLAACAGLEAPDPGVEALELTRLAPATIVPGTRLVVTGASFVDAPWGQTTLHLRGRTGARAVDVAWPAAFADFTTLGVAIDRARLDALGGDGAFRGTATVEVVTPGDRRYASAPRPVELELRTRLAPATAAVASRGVIFVNDAVELTGDGFLLGGDEGESAVQVAGCFSPQAGGACRPVATVELPLTPVAQSRSRARFAFSPRIAGIQPGSFTGTIAVVNRQPGEAPIAAAPVEVAYELVTAQVFSLDPPAASLGQYVVFHGGGFVSVSGGEPGAVTELELSGTVRKSGAALPLAMTLIPDVVDGRLARYVINTDDALGHAFDLRGETGELTGSVTPVVSFGGDRVRGQPAPIRLAIAPIKQVVYLAFEPSYVEGLRDFGLRAVDAQIRERVLAACREAYRGVGIEFRVDPPADFALYSTVELVGVDPNDQGLFGYDNSPGKDSGNLRLYDRLGGVNAETQADGYPGFGGVFVRSLMGFSQHPGRLARSVDGADPVFDQLFDPFRPDRGGAPVSAADLASELPVLADGAACPARDRAQQIRCAIFVLGNLIGGTVAHEIGHSLGLANPYQDGFHDPGDAPDRLMDAGDARPFLERAQLMGQGPAVFCDGEYAYLRRILPSAEPVNAIARPGCS